MTIDNAVEAVISNLLYARRGKMFGHTAFFARAAEDVRC
jgi:hypothetical protein